MAVGVVILLPLLVAGACALGMQLVDRLLDPPPSEVAYAQRVDPEDGTVANPSADDGCWTVGLLGRSCIQPQPESTPVAPPDLGPRVLSECSFDHPCTHDRHCVEGWCVECQMSSECAGDDMCRNGRCVLTQEAAAIDEAERGPELSP